MPTNKNAYSRYKALDKCFRNWSKLYSIDDLVQECNKALSFREDIIEEHVKKRQVYADIEFMESDKGWSIPLERNKDGRKVYFRYSDKDFSILNQPLSDTDINQLREAILSLNRLKGMPSFEWIDELITKLEDQFQLTGNKASVIGFEQNQYLKGIEYISDIFNSIINKQCLRITYCKFQGPIKIWDIHPYYIKQYNNRWFLLGLNNKYNDITTIPLDRITSIEQLFIEYKPTDIDFEEYFDDIIGVTIPKDKEVENILLKFSEKRFPYVTSKPIHWSQKIKDAENHIIEISVIPNKELISILLSYGDDVEIISPEEVRNTIKDIISNSYKKYF